MTKRHPYTWIPTLYFLEGIPYIIVTSVALILYKRLGLSDTQCTLYASWLSLPWVFKPLWSPIVDIFKTKRWWICTMQSVIAVLLAAVAFTIPSPHFVQWSLAFFFLIAIQSATHDIAADGFYMIAQSEHEQTLNVGVRNTFFRLAMIFGEGLLLMLIGFFEVYTRRPKQAWAWGFGVIAVLFFTIALYHFLILPHAERTSSQNDHRNLRKTLKQVGETFLTFLQKREIIPAISFLLLYRFPEALLTKITPLFLSESINKGGLALSTAELGFAKGTVGVIGLTLGGIVGGIVMAKDGFRQWLWPMVYAISLPNIFYVFLAYYQPENTLWVNISIAIEQFGYGFGLTLYMVFMLQLAQGPYKTAHYALCTGFMALSMTLPGMAAGWIADHLGYYKSFILIMLLVPITFIVAALIKVPKNFGQQDFKSSPQE